MYIKEKYSLDNFPVWALTALFNDDVSGLTDDDLELFKQFEKQYSDVVTWDCHQHQLDNPHFLINPAFGLATDCVKVKGYVYAGRTL